MKSLSPSTNKMQLTVIFIAYLIFALIFGFAYRFAINPDGVSLLRLAGYIAEGNFQYSVTSGYPPLISWLIAPFIFFGLDGLTSARIVIALSGAGLVMISWLLACRFNFSDNIKFISVLVATLLISFWTIKTIGADILVAALILCYIYLVTEPDILSNRKRLFFCGITGGFSYLAHHFAFPLFLSHFPLMLFLRAYIDKDKDGFLLKKVLRAWGIGLAGFFIVASIWVGIMSVKYGHLTISSAASAAHAVMGPKDTDRRHPFFIGGLYKPRESYQIHVFEDPSEVKFKTWSPFESKEYFIYQLKLIKENSAYILNHFVNNSPFFVYALIIGVLTIIPISLFLTPLNDEKKYLYLWIIMTFTINCSIFLLTIARSPRRFYALMIIFLFLSVHFLEELRNGVTNIISSRRKKLLTYYLLLIVVSAFTLKPGMHFLNSINDIIAGKQVNPYKKIAEQLNKVDFSAPYAIIRSSQKLHTDYYIAYFLGKQLLGRPLSQDIEGITKELKDAGAKSLVVFDNPKIVKELMNDKRYIRLASEKLKKDSRYLYAVNIQQDEIKGWDEDVNIFTLK
jgi:4-amino-4-deoxy-L-arabinose transferase-like glycosyltransferase